MAQHRLRSVLIALGLVASTSIVLGTADTRTASAAGISDCPTGTTDTAIRAIGNQGAVGARSGTLPDAVDITLQQGHGGGGLYNVALRDSSVTLTGVAIQLPSSVQKLTTTSLSSVNTPPNTRHLVFCLKSTAAPAATLGIVSPTYPDTDGDGISNTAITAPGPMVVQLSARNTGNVPLTQAGIVTPAGVTGFTCTPAKPATLAVNATMTCNGTRNVTQADIDANASLVVRGIFGGFGGSTFIEEQTTLTTPIDQTVGLTVDKTSTSHPDDDNNNIADAKLVGPGTIVYQFTLRNTGNVDLTNLDLDDPFLDRVSCSLPAMLAPSATFQCTGETDVSQADIDAGIDFINTVTATATGAGQDVKDTASYGIAVDRDIRPTITKSSPNFPDTNGDGAADTNAELDDFVEYEVVVTNSGNVSFDVDSVTDLVSNGDTSSPWTITACDVVGTTLAPGASGTCSGTYQVTQPDIDADGLLTNTATVNVTGANGATTDASAHYRVPLLEQSSIAIRKTSPTHPDTDGDRTSDTPVDLGSTNAEDVDFIVEIENTGTTTLTLDEIRDQFPLSCPGFIPGTTTLAPAEVLTCTATVTVDRTLFETETELRNLVAVRASDPSGTDVGTGTYLQVPFDRQPDITLAKTAAAPFDDGDADRVSDTPLDAPATVTYLLDATNTGNVTLTDVQIADATVTGLTCTPTAPATLAPGEAISCSGTRDIGQVDINAGGTIVNTAFLVATAPGGEPVSESSYYSIPVDATAEISLTKASINFTDGDDDGVAESPLTGAGDIEYEIEAENTGKVTLTNVVVTDPDVPGLSCSPASGSTLQPGDTMTCTATVTVDQTRFDAGQPVVNSASVTTDQPATDHDTFTVKLAPQPAITLTKTTTATSITAVDQVVPYEFIATNAGNTTLTDVEITDNRLTGLSSCTPPADSTLLPGETMMCTGDYTVTQADLDSGTDLFNRATASGRGPGGATWFGRATTSTPVVTDPSITIDKTTNTTAVDNTGPVTIDYDIVVVNDGNVTLTGVTVSDPRLPDLACTPLIPATLAPTQQMTCTGSHDVDQAELDSGQPVVNTATVTTSEGVTDASRVEVPNNATAKLSLAKTPQSGDPITAEGDLLYDYVVTNTGGETLTDVAVTDSLIPGLTCETAELLPGAQLTCVGAYTVTQADLDAGGTLVNEGVARATTPASSLVRAHDFAAIPIQAVRSIALEKNSTNFGDVDDDDISETSLTMPDTITYTFDVTNTGTATLTDVQLVDPDVTGLNCPAGALTSLAPGATANCTATRVITQTDIDAGGAVVNTAIAFAPAQGAAATDSHDIPVDLNPDLTLTKVALGQFGDADGNNQADIGVGAPGTITYELVATNTGNQTLTNVGIVDPSLGALSCTQPVDLAPTESLTCTGTYVVDQGDIDNGAPIVNLADAGSDQGATDTAAYVIPVLRIPGIVLTKTSPSHPDTDADGVADVPISAAGDVDYRLTARNVGNVSLTDVSFSDPALPGLSCAPVTLQPGETVVCDGTRNVDQSVIDGGLDVLNTATVTANAGTQTLSDRASYDIPVERIGSISVVKSASAPYGDVNADGVADAAVALPGNVTYELLVTNTGNVTVTSLTAEDVITGDSVTTPTMSCPVSSLAPGTSTTCTVDYSVTQADIDNILPIDDVATAMGTAAGGGTVSASAAYLVPVLAVSDLTIRKSIPANPDTNGDFVGDTPLTGPATIVYEIAVGNGGTVDLTDVTVVDPTLDSLSCPSGIPFDLAPGELETCTGEIVVSQTDFDTGYVPPFGGDPVAGIINIATAEGLGPETPPVPVRASWVAAVEFDWEPSITLTKTSTTHPDADGDGIADTAITAPGSVTYELVATNDGNVTLTDVEILDPDIATLTCVPVAPATLAPGESITCTGDSILDQDDIDAGGDYVNVATARSSFAAHEVSDRAVYDVPIGTAPSLVLTKTSTSHPDTDANGIANTPLDAPGDVEYQLVATNDGNVTLTGVTVNDPDVTGLSCNPVVPATLDPGDSITCTAEYTADQTVIDAGGDLVNIASATGTGPAGGTFADQAAYDVPIERAPAIAVDKTPVEQEFDVGDTPTIMWTITVRNTGNVTLTDVVIDDGLVVDTSGDLAPLTSCDRTFDSLAPGASRTIPCSTTRTIVPAEIANHVTASGTSPIGPIEAQAVAVVRSVTEAPPTTAPVTPTTPTTTPNPDVGVPTPTVPPTGGNTEPGLVLGMFLLVTGIVTLGVSRRPGRGRTSAA